MKKKMSRFLAAVLTSAMVLTGLSPTGVLAADVNAVAGEVQETAVVDETGEVPAAEVFETGAAESEVLAAESDAFPAETEDSDYVIEETAAGTEAISEETAVTAEETAAAAAETETEAPAAAEADSLDAVAEVGEKKVEIGMPGVTLVEDGSPKVYMNYFPTEGLSKGAELPDFKEAVADDPNNTIYFQEVTAAEAADGTGSLLAVNWQGDGEELDGLRYPKYVQYTQNAKAGTSGLGNNNEPMPVDSEWKVPTQGALVIHPKYGADGKPMDASLKIVGTQGSANRGMSVLKVADDAEDKTKGIVHYSQLMTGKIETLNIPLDGGYTYYVFGNGTKIKFYSISVAYPSPVDWKDVEKPVLDDPVVSEDGRTVDITWHGKVGDYEENYKGKTDLWKYADYITVELRAAQKIGSYFKQGDLVGEPQTFSSLAESGVMTFAPPYSGNYYFRATLGRATGESWLTDGYKNLNNYVLPMEYPKGVTYNGMGLDAGGETASVSLSWGSFDEATSYRVYYKEKGAAEYTLYTENGADDTTAILKGLTPDKEYLVAVTSVRANSKTGESEETLDLLEKTPEDDPENLRQNPVYVTPTSYVTKNWYAKGFGTGANKTLYSSKEELIKEKTSCKGLWYTGKPDTEEGHGLHAEGGNLLTMSAEGNTGKVQDSTHDGLFFYYTTIDPERENFTLSANVTLDRWDGSTGQEGFGLAALDRVPGSVKIDNDNDGDDFWNNEYLAGCTKIQFYWDKGTQQPTTATPSDDNPNIKTKSMRVGPGIVEKTGITKAMLDAKLTTAQMGQNLSRTWYTLSHAAGWAITDPRLCPTGKTIDDQNVNLCGNIYATTAKDGSVEYRGPGSEYYAKNGKAGNYLDVANYTNFDISITRHNTCYTIWIRSNELDADGNIIPGRSEDHYENCWFPNTGDPLLRADTNNIYVGFYVARNAQMTVNSYDLKLINPEDDEDVKKVYPRVDSSFRVVSDLSSTKPAYKYGFLPNAPGRLYLERGNYDKETKKFTRTSWVIGPSSIPVLVGQDEAKNVGVTLKKGDNYFRYTFVPTNPRQKDPSAPHDEPNEANEYSKENIDSDYYKVDDSYVPAATENLLKSYYPDQNIVNVKYGTLSTTSAQIDGKTVKNVVYVAPNGGEMNPDGTFTADGTKTKPYSLQTALNFALPGYTILMKDDDGGIYSPTAPQEPFEVYSQVSGIEPKPIVLMPDPEAKKRPLIDVNGDVDHGGFADNEGFVLGGSYWHIKDFDITNSSEGEEGLHVGGNYNVIENMNIYRNRGSGVQVSRIGVGGRPSNNTLRNIWSFLNRDKGDADADGFGMKLTIGEGNVCENCVAALNTDDGWDLYAKETEIGAVTIRNCVAFLNGFKYDEEGNLSASGNGNGFKLGGNSLPGKHRIINSVAFLNKLKGIDTNHCPDVIITNCSSYNNSKYNFNIETQSWETTNFYVNGAVSYRTPEIYDPHTLSGNSIENWAYLVMDNEDYQEKYFKVYLEDNIDLLPPQQDGKDPAVYGENNYYSFGNENDEVPLFHNFTASTLPADYTSVDDTWFENLDWISAVNGFIYYTQEELGAAHPDVPKYGAMTFGLENDKDVKKPEGDKGFRKLPNGTIDFGGFMALTAGHDGTGATLATSHEEAKKADDALASAKTIKATGIKITKDKEATKAANNGVDVNPTLMNEGQKVVYTAYATPQNANAYNSIKWYAQNEDVAKVSARIDVVKNDKGVSYEQYTVTVTGASEGKTKIIGETGDGVSTKIQVKVIQDQNQVMTGMVTKPVLATKKIKFYTGSRVPVQLGVTNGINRTVESVTLLSFKRGKKFQLTAAQTNNFFVVGGYDPSTCSVPISLGPSDTDYGTNELGKRVYKTTDDNGYALKGKYSGTLRVVTKDENGSQVNYDYKFKITVSNKPDQMPVMDLLQPAYLDKGALPADSLSGNAFEEKAYAQYRILAGKGLPEETKLAETVSVISDSQPSEIDKLPYKQRAQKQKYCYFQKADYDSENGILSLALVQSVDGKSKLVDKKVRVSVRYEDGTYGDTFLTVTTAARTPREKSGSLKSSYNAGGNINIAARSTTFAQLKLGDAKVDTIEMADDKNSKLFGIRPGSKVTNAYEIYAYEDSVLNSGYYEVKVKINGTAVPVKLRTVFAPGKVTSNPKVANLNLNSESVVVMEGQMSSKKWEGEVLEFSSDVANSKDKGGRNRILLKKGLYKNVKLGRGTGEKVNLNVQKDIKFSDVIKEEINYDKVQLTALSLSDSTVVDMLNLTGDKAFVKNADGSADLSDEHTRQVIEALYQKLPKQAMIQYTVIYKGQNKADAKQSKRVISQKIMLKQL